MTVNTTVGSGTQTEVAEPAEEPGAPTGALLALGLAALVAVLDGTVVSVALRTLTADLHAPLTTVVWTSVGYLLAAATMLPLLNWATARFGGRLVFLVGLGLFGLGSALSALAWSAGALIAFRVVQGLGGGLLEPTSLMLAARLARQDRVGRVLGTISMIINVAPALGPVVGGLLLATGHWQWIFVVNIPLTLGLFAVAIAFIPADRPTGRAEAATGGAGTEPAAAPRADLRGLALLTTGYVGLLFALTRSGQAGADAVTITAAVAGAALLAGYVRHALTARTPPAFDLRLLRRPGFATSLAVMCCVGLLMYGQQAALPIFGADRHHLRGAGQGLLVCALGLGLFVSMSWGGRVSDRTGPRPLVRAGAVVTAAGLTTFAFAHDRLPLPAVFALFVGIGLGFGLTASPTFATVFRLLPPAEQPQGTTAVFMSVQLSASLGVTTLGLLQARAGAHWLTWLFVLLAAAAVAMLVLSRGLPGRPTDAQT
ncbi:MFS transporter [Frankia sp. AgB1.9]|uniref:MFS transporter n=1 Tax=unclassified Frankia TaxID=2632575 RepID=UPI0019316BB7|nr:MULTISPECIES: MFS transporter [unclassified Frankia]MBL7490774.1 MFS transporter [Frankia sp. AgW1.1]MBL7550347.1 MFS transporter [Frankia sp. AgB1.9]MBL7621020.1 MFS transporter [Frankia sp. AgB1.8]